MIYNIKMIYDCQCHNYIVEDIKINGELSNNEHTQWRIVSYKVSDIIKWITNGLIYYKANRQ